MATPGQLQMYNKMEISEMFGLDQRAYDPRIGAIRRIAIYPDEKVPDAAIFKIWLEDHTLGNILRMELLRNENVLFAGYKVPHPLDHMIELRVQTLPKSSPQTALRLAVRNLRGEAKSMLEQFDIGVAALQRGEKHRPELPLADQQRMEGGGVNTDMDTQSSDHGGAGATSDDMARRTQEPGGMDEDEDPDPFQSELNKLQTLESFGGGVGDTAFSPTSEAALSEDIPIAPGSTPGLTPGVTPGDTPGLTPGPSPGATPGLTPGPSPGAGYTPGATPGLTPGPSPGVTPGRTPGLTPGPSPGSPGVGTEDGDAEMEG